jgi:lipoprotein-anchoring transpeptidase ErfK/SrfK
VTAWRVVLAGAVLAAVLASMLLRDPAASTRSRAGALPAPPRSALAIPEPVRLAGEEHVSVWAPLRRAVAARVGPSATRRVIARLADRTPEGTPHPLPVLGRRTASDGRVWVRVRLPVLPNGTAGWVPRRALGAYELEHHRLVVDLRRLRATLYERGRAVLRAAIGIGAARWPTPRGDFLVRNRLERYDSPRYGPVAFGTSARSATLTDWPAGGFVGIHGTDRPDLLPGRVSHGCIRMRNADVLRLATLMPVGTPVTIR